MIPYDFKYTTRYFNSANRLGLEKAKETLLENYDESIRNIDKLRYAGNDHGVKLTDKKHNAMISFANSQLGEKLKRIVNAQKHLRSRQIRECK